MQPKVGIVILSYNASQAVRITLASIRQAQNDTSAKLILIDNASFEIEREKIRLAFEQHTQEASLPWEHIQLDKNAGFSGGNNIGIKHLLEDPEISHICLLNSDVIVTDQWLDRLINSNVDIVSAVTNKAESEQCIPVDYTISMEDCLSGKTETINTNIFNVVNSFAKDWHTAWTDNLVEGEATFFCVLLSRKAIEDIGMLDETFFPGGYEDEDFCLRARQHGYKVHIARDVYIHHWGSASFGQLQFEYFNQNASRNLNYLESKHGIIRRRRPEKPFASFLLDIKFITARTKELHPHLRRRFHTLYTSHLSVTLKHFESEFNNLQQMVFAQRWDIPDALQARLDNAQQFDNIMNNWNEIISKTETIFAGKSDTALSASVLSSFEHLMEGIRQRVDCNFAMHEFLFKAQNEKTNKEASMRPRLTLAIGLQKIRSYVNFCIRGLRLLWSMQGIVFFGGYPYPELQSDGYYQRIRMVDRLFADRWRIYISRRIMPDRHNWFDHPEAKVLVLRASGRYIHQILAQTIGLICILKCRKVYFHSILTMHNKAVHWLLHIPSLTKIIDIHGVVTEEFRLNNDFYNAILYEKTERLAISKCDYIVVVTKSMEDYLRQKYKEIMRGRAILFPMFPNYQTNIASRPYVKGKPVIVYAGGLQKWQQVSKMIEAIRYTASLYEHRFYCPEPHKIRELLPATTLSKITVDHKTPDELASLYAECHYGFILREDNVVNHVACPTKLVEYLAMGIIPIVNTENIGDFKKMGMQYIMLDVLLKGTLPDELQRLEMARLNSEIYERFRNIYKQGAYEMHTALTGGLKDWDEGQRLQWLKRLLPPNTRLGHWVRLLWIKSKTIIQKVIKKQYAIEIADTVPLPECDILVQVDNFESGGLENIALDINDSLIRAGHKIVLLVLGKAGVGVEKARERGIAVIMGSPEAEWYQTFIKLISPQLILSHYSIHGIDFCHKAGIPFVQVIQSIYMWFNQQQLADFKKAAELTSQFIALSEFAKQYSVQRLGVDASRCLVLPCGIDCTSFDNPDVNQERSNLRSQYGFKDNNFVFLSVGAINHQKNHIATVRAFASIAKEIPLARLLILGPAYEKSLLDEILQFVKKQELGDRIIYAGSAPSAHKYYAMSDAFVSASFFEGGPLNLLESLKANLPIIMTNVGLALHFQGFRGVQIIEPPVDIFKFEGNIWDLSSTPEFEENLARAMQNVAHTPQRPDASPELLQSFDKSQTYLLYLEALNSLSNKKAPDSNLAHSTWISNLDNLSKNNSQ